MGKFTGTPLLLDKKHRGTMLFRLGFSFQSIERCLGFSCWCSLLVSKTRWRPAAKHNIDPYWSPFHQVQDLKQQATGSGLVKFLHVGNNMYVSVCPYICVMILIHNIQTVASKLKNQFKFSHWIRHQWSLKLGSREGIDWHRFQGYVPKKCTQQK